MKIAVMQPYLFPYLGYFQLIHSVDKFIVYGHVQYIKKGWFNRNRILLNGKPFMFTFSLINDDYRLQAFDRFYSLKFEDEKKWFLKTIKNAYGRAPYFDNVYALIEQILQFKNTNLVEFNYNSILRICEFMAIETKIEINESIEKENLDKQDRVLKFCKINNAYKYVNPIGGIQLYEKKYFSDNSVELNFLQSKLPAYDQFRNEFVPGLSIIDVLMFNSIEDTKAMLNGYQFI